MSSSNCQGSPSALQMMLVWFQILWLVYVPKYKTKWTFEERWLIVDFRLSLFNGSIENLIKRKSTFQQGLGKAKIKIYKQHSQSPERFESSTSILRNYMQEGNLAVKIIYCLSARYNKCLGTKSTLNRFLSLGSRWN